MLILHYIMYNHPSTLSQFPTITVPPAPLVPYPLPIVEPPPPPPPEYGTGFVPPIFLLLPSPPLP